MAPLLNTEELPPPAGRVTPATHRDTCLVSESRDNTCLVCSTWRQSKVAGCVTCDVSGTKSLLVDLITAPSPSQAQAGDHWPMGRCDGSKVDEVASGRCSAAHLQSPTVRNNRN